MTSGLLQFIAVIFGVLTIATGYASYLVGQKESKLALAPEAIAEKVRSDGNNKFLSAIESNDDITPFLSEIPRYDIPEKYFDPVMERLLLNSQNDKSLTEGIALLSALRKKFHNRLLNDDRIVPYLGAYMWSVIDWEIGTEDEKKSFILRSFEKYRDTPNDISLFRIQACISHIYGNYSEDWSNAGAVNLLFNTFPDNQSRKALSDIFEQDLVKMDNQAFFQPALPDAWELHRTANRKLLQKLEAMSQTDE